MPEMRFALLRFCNNIIVQNATRRKRRKTKLRGGETFLWKRCTLRRKSQRDTACLNARSGNGFDSASFVQSRWVVDVTECRQTHWQTLSESPPTPTKKKNGGKETNELQVFNNSEFGELRTVTIDGESWFVGKDVATALGYNNSRDAIAKHVDAEDLNTVAIRDGVKGNPNMTIINESGLYTLILSSKLPTVHGKPEITAVAPVMGAWIETNKIKG